jgi:hypothetical protein
VVDTTAALEITRDRPPVTLLWLDTWVFIRLAKRRAGAIKDGDADDLRVIDERLLALRDAKQLICPETGHDIEVEAGGRLVEETRRVMSQVSLGVQTHYDHARQHQVFRALRAFSFAEPTLHLPWNDVFMEDPLREIAEKDVLIRVDINTTGDQLRDIARQNTEMARQLEQIRLVAVAERHTFEQRFEIEMGGIIEATIASVAATEGKVARRGQPSVDDLLTYIHVVGQNRTLLGDYLEEATGRHGDLGDLIRFYRSPHYTGLPYERIRAELYSVLLVGGDPIRASDVMDMNQIAALLPFAHAMVLDKAMAHRVRRRKLGERYGTIIMSKLSDLRAYLERLPS